MPEAAVGSRTKHAPGSLASTGGTGAAGGAPAAADQSRAHAGVTPPGTSGGSQDVAAAVRAEKPRAEHPPGAKRKKVAAVEENTVARAAPELAKFVASLQSSMAASTNRRDATAGLVVEVSLLGMLANRGRRISSACKTSCSARRSCEQTTKAAPLLLRQRGGGD